MSSITAILLLFTVVTAKSFADLTVTNTESYRDIIYQASIQNASNQPICNGVIVAANFILTSAQCVANYKANELNVFYGSNHLNNDGMFVNVKEIYINPGFNKTIIKNDLALLLTNHNMDFIANVSGPINLPKHDVPVHRLLTASGWKLTVSLRHKIYCIEIRNLFVTLAQFFRKFIQFQAKNGDLVQQCRAKVITLNECKETNPSLNHILRPWLICSVDPINQENICAEVLGSPLVTNNSILYGIMTMNEETAINSSLNIYANIFDQIIWIRYIIYGWP